MFGKVVPPWAKMEQARPVHYWLLVVICTFLFFVGVHPLKGRWFLLVLKLILAALLCVPDVVLISQTMNRLGISVNKWCCLCREGGIVGGEASNGDKQSLLLTLETVTSSVSLVKNDTYEEKCGSCGCAFLELVFLFWPGPKHGSVIF